MMDLIPFRLEPERCSVQQLLGISAASAQRTLAVIERCTDRLGVRTVETIAGLVDGLWASLSTGSAVSPADRELAERLVPDDDDENWSPATAYLENAAAATAYALSVALEGGVQNAFWSVSQVSDLAYFEALRQNPDLDLDTEMGRVAVLSSEVIQVSISGIRADLRSVMNETSPTELRARVCQDSVLWALFFKG